MLEVSVLKSDNVKWQFGSSAKNKGIFASFVFKEGYFLGKTFEFDDRPLE